MAWASGWVKWAVLGLWTSFWAVWLNPLTYPIIAALAFLSFSVGHHEGRRGLTALQTQHDIQLRAVADSNRRLRVTADMLVKENEELRAHLPKVAAPVPPPATPSKAPVPQKPKKVKDEGVGLWSWVP
jgi:hypothetical protein